VLFQRFWVEQQGLRRALQAVAHLLLAHGASVALFRVSPV
jgi:hypothetical protein